MLKQILAGVLGVLGSTAIMAQEASTESHILETLSQARPDIEFGEVAPAPIEGLYQVQVVGGPILYVNPEADKMIAGEMFAIDQSGFSRLEDPRAVKKREEAVQSLPEADSINFAPEGETRAVVYVFTDVDCGYCRRLHSQLDEYREGGETRPGYRDLGIEIRYLAYPRAGVGSPSARKLETAWCSDNQQQALDRLKNLQQVDPVQCDHHPVAEHYRLGGEVGVNGTPALLLPNGKLQPGYVPPERLAQVLGL